MPKKLVIIDQPVGNRGDQAAHGALMELLKSRQFDVTVLFAGDENYYRPFHQHISGIQYRCIPAVRGTQRFKSLFYRSPLTAALNRAFPSTRAAASIMRQADAVVCAPGGIAMGGYRDWHHLWKLNLALACNDRVAIWGRSIGPFYDRTYFDRRFARISQSILRRVGFLSLRDLKSQELARSFGLECCPTIDTALAFTPTPAIPANLERVTDQDYVVFVPNELCTWQPFFRNTPPKMLDDFYVRIIEHVAGKGLATVMLPQLFNRGARGDVHYFERLRQRVSRPETVVVVPETHDSDIQQAIIARSQALVGARYHSVIFAVNNAVPFVCLSYEHKMHDTLRLLGLTDYSIDLKSSVDRGDVRSVLDRLDAVLETRRQLRPVIQRKREEAAGIVRTAFDRFCNYLADSA